MKREGQTVCSLEAEVEINAYIKIADEMNQRIADARTKVDSLRFPEINNYLFRSRHFRNFEIDL